MTGDKMKSRMILLCILALSALAALTAVAVPAVPAATPEGDFIDMYKGFFRDMQANRHEEVWNSLTNAGKNAIAETLRESIASRKLETTRAVVLDRLNRNSSNIRAEYFAAMNDRYEQISFYDRVLKGKYRVKSSSKDLVILTISINGEPKDFQIIREEGRWKINFFEDMLR
jgi:hypothetical protein